MGHHADRAGRDRQDGMVHRLHQDAVEVDKVAGHVKGRDLALAIHENIVARGQAGDENRTLRWAVPLPHHVLTLCDRSLPNEDVLQHLSLRSREVIILLKFADQEAVRNGLSPESYR